MNDSEIIKLGNPLLRLVSTAINEEMFGTSELIEFSKTLFKTMAIENGLGLASPQIGINKRAIVFGMHKHPIKPSLIPIPYTILFNPVFKPSTDIMEDDYEGCLSIGYLRGKVSRYKTIYYSGYDTEGNLIEREVSDLHARVVQHEIDHLDGIVFLDKISNYHSLGFHNELVDAGVFPRPQVS